MSFCTALPTHYSEDPYFLPKPLRRFIRQPLIAFGIDVRGAHIGMPQPRRVGRAHAVKIIRVNLCNLW
jgi:hypothetical protein